MLLIFFVLEVGIANSRISRRRIGLHVYFVVALGRVVAVSYIYLLNGLQTKITRMSGDDVRVFYEKYL